MNVKKFWNQEVDNMDMAHLTLEPRGRHMHGQGVPMCYPGNDELLMLLRDVYFI
jgi:hypothetical protein